MHKEIPYGMSLYLKKSPKQIDNNSEQHLIIKFAISSNIDTVTNWHKMLVLFDT
jgi:hypothetical protein